MHEHVEEEIRRNRSYCCLCLGWDRRIVYLFRCLQCRSHQASSRNRGQVLHKIMVESVRHHARDIRLPVGIDLHDRALAEKTFGYTKACRTCHGAPGVKPDVWVYLYPPAPDLTRSDMANQWSDAELYWIIKNGIEHTGMTGLGPTHQDEEIWSVSAFVRQLLTMSSAEYQLVADKYAASQKNGEHPD